MNNAQPTSPGFVFAATLKDCRPDVPLYIEVANRMLILVSRSSAGDVACLGALCPHEGASLAGGQVTHGRVVCPQHHLEFDLETGACRQMPELGLDRYDTRIQNGDVLVCPEPIHYVPPMPES